MFLQEFPIPHAYLGQRYQEIHILSESEPKTKDTRRKILLVESPKPVMQNCSEKSAREKKISEHILLKFISIWNK